MINKIVNLLNNNKKISAWTITESQSKSSELFFVKEKLDMNRATNIHEFTLRIFVDFEEGGEKYKGDATMLVSPTDTQEEITSKIEQGVFSAGFVKNKWYDLPENEDIDCPKIQKFSNISDLNDNYEKLYNIIFKDYGFDSKLNSAELFAIEGSKRVVTSKGVDESFPYNEFTFEIVTDCNSGSEPVEIFKDYSLTNIDLKQIENIIKLQHEETEGRSKAVKNEKIENARVILSGDAVEELLSFYTIQASDSLVFMNISKVKVGSQFIDIDAAEKLNIKLNPSLASSTFARPVDSEGKKLQGYDLFKNGKSINLITSSRFSHYLDLENKGTIKTFEVEGGQLSLDEYLKEDHIEILAFSSFLMDPTTGDFGGEFRLARYVHDGKIEYITGGSISENIFKEQNKMKFSKELENRKLSIAPKAIIFDGITVTGK